MMKKTKAATIIMEATTALSGTAPGGVKDWPSEVCEIRYATEADNSRQPAIFYAPKTAEPKPLLVALHTWSNDYRHPEPAYVQWCIRNGWCFIRPDFRGPNRTPQALGSELVVQDIVGAVQYAADNCAIDTNRIYLVGVSGGGHAALLMAGRRPDIWAGVSAWCGIAGIRQWWQEKKPLKSRYADDIEKACGGAPDSVARSAEECRKRSPLTYLANAGGVNLDINAGVRDGRSGSVPFTHSLHAFNAAALTRDKIAEPDIAQFYETMTAPAHLAGDVNDPLYGSKKPLFRRVSGNVRITIFDGGHEIVHNAALNWLAQQRKGRPAVWDIRTPLQLDVSDKDAQSGL